MKGYIYVLTNPAMPGLVKIGRSIHGGAKRAKQLSTTGVPHPFVLEFEMMFENLEHVEVRLHEKFNDRRANESREFFAVDVEEACSAIVNEWLFARDQAAVVIDEAIGLQMVSSKAHRLGVPDFELCQALGFVDDEVLDEGLRKALDARRSKPYQDWGLN